MQIILYGEEWPPMQAGVACLKIEGRLKGPEYVALTTRVYRDAVDRAWSALMGPPSAVDPQTLLDASTHRDLQQVFARGQDEVFTGLTPGFLDGPRHQQLVQGKNSRHRGVCLGRCRISC
jgi:U32 family peptidase